MDFGVLYCGYCSDMTRTVAVGFVTEEMEKVYNTVLQAQKAGIAATRAGVKGKDVDAAARKVICDAADKGDCVIVGRRADKILEGRDNVLSVFIGADMDDRVKTYMQRHDANEKIARKTIERKDRERMAYYNYFADGKWGKASNYHLCFNTSKVSCEKIVDTICNFVER